MEDKTINIKNIKQSNDNDSPEPASNKVEEIGGPPGPEPTRHGDWHYNGRCTDF